MANNTEAFASRRTTTEKTSNPRPNNHALRSTAPERASHSSAAVLQLGKLDLSAKQLTFETTATLLRESEFFRPNFGGGFFRAVCSPARVPFLDRGGHLDLRSRRISMYVRAARGIRSSMAERSPSNLPVSYRALRGTVPHNAES